MNRRFAAALAGAALSLGGVVLAAPVAHAVGPSETALAKICEGFGGFANVIDSSNTCSVRSRFGDTAVLDRWASVVTASGAWVVVDSGFCDLWYCTKSAVLASSVN